MDVRPRHDSLVPSPMNSTGEHGGGIVPDRSALGFAGAVTDAFGFLVEDFGFKVVGTDATLVRYESDRMLLNVYHGRRSYEIGVEVGHLHERDAYHYRLPEVLGAILGESGQQNAYYFQSSSRDGVRSCVEAAARLVKENYGPLLRGDPIALKRVQVFSSRRNEEYTREVVQQPIRESADRAWRAKDFAMVVQCYGSIRKDLTPTERRRLEYAEKQLLR